MRRIIGLFILSIILNIHVFAQATYSYDESLLALSGDGQVIAVSGRSISDSSARLGFRAPIDFYDTNTGNLINSFTGSEDGIEGLALNSDGTLLAYSNANGRLAIVDILTNSEINVFVQGGFRSIGYPVFGRDNRTIASFTTATVDLFDAFPPRNRLSTYTDAVTGEILGFDYSADGTLIAYSTNNMQTSNGILVLVSIQPDFTAQLLHVVDAPSTLSVAVSDDGTQVASASNNGVLITNISDESQYLLPHNAVGDVVVSLDWSSNGDKIAAGGYDTITIWDIQTGEVIETIETEDIVSNIFWSPDGEYIYHSGGAAGVYRDGLPLWEAIAQSED